MSGFERRLLGIFGILGILVAVPAGAQENLDLGKTPAQLFASDCVICHKSPQGLARGKILGLDSFLREHYTASRESAAAIANYLQAMDRGPAAPAPGRAVKRTPAGDDKAKTAKPGDKKPGAAKPADAKSSEPKSSEPKTSEPKSSEPKASEPKPSEPKSSEPKTSEPKASEPKASEPKASESKPSVDKASEPKASEPKASEPKPAEGGKSD